MMNWKACRQRLRFSTPARRVKINIRHSSTLSHFPLGTVSRIKNQTIHPLIFFFHFSLSSPTYPLVSRFG